MKFDDQLAAYLYEHKSLRLEGLGTFLLDSKVSVPHQQEKEIYYPIEGLSFIYDPKCSTDENVITFMVKKLGKIQPLIRSDLESYLSNIKQFINIGKPYTIEGIGTLSKNNNGTYEFTPGNFLPVKEELNPRRENAEHNYPVRSKSSAGRIFVVILIVLAALAALAGIGWGISNLLSRTSTSTPVTETGQQGMIDTLPQPNVTDTSHKPSIVTATTLPQKDTAKTSDSARYKMIFEVTRDKQRAISRTLQLHSYNTKSRYDSLLVNDTIRYRLYIPLKLSIKDTFHIKDSLGRFLGRKIIMERQ